jgi:hypothetical protein
MVRVQIEDETLLLSVRNLSLGGALLSTDRDLEDFPIGSQHVVLVFDAANAERQPARVTGEVVRHEPGAFAVRFLSRDPLANIRLTLLFSELNSQTKPS